MAEIVRVIDSCRSCGSANLKDVLLLGEIYVSDFVKSGAEHGKAPLHLVLCMDCSLLQLKHTINPELLYREYWYKSGINEMIVSDLKDIACKATQMVNLEPADLVLDIGCNDGTLLRSYLVPGLKLVGFEPARNLVKEAEVGTTEIINDFFSWEEFHKRCGDQKAIVVTTIAMFYDLDDPNKFVSDIAKCLDKNGVWILEMRYLPLMLGQTDIGNICHEHLEYYSLRSLSHLLWRHKLQVFDVELNQVNGGSFRTYIRHAGVGGSVIEEGRQWRYYRSFPTPLVDGRVKQLETLEWSIHLETPNPYVLFSERVQDIAQKLCNFVKSEHDKGKIIHVYGASTKGNTMLQCFGLDHTLIEAAAERDPRKFGKITVGTEIPIISEAESRKRANYYLILPWHFLNVFIKREEDFLKSGGKFIVPLPDFKVIGWEEVNAAQ